MSHDDHVPAAVELATLAEAHAATYAQCAHDLRGAVGLLAGAVDEVEAVCDVPEDVRAFVRRGRERIEHLARRWSLVADLLRSDVDGNSTLGRVDLGELVTSAATDAEHLGRITLVRSGETCALRADPELSATALTELALAGGRTLGRRLRIDARTEGDRCVMRLGPEPRGVGDGASGGRDGNDPDAPAWPRLRGHPSTDGLPGRAGLWLGISLLGTQGVSVEVSPTAPEYLRISWPRG